MCVCVCVCKCVWVFTLPPPRYESSVTHVQFVERSTTSLLSEFIKTVCLIKVKEPNLAYYSPIARVWVGREGFIYFPRVLSRSWTQTSSFRIWTRDTNSVSYDRNRFTKCSSIYIFARARVFSLLIINSTFVISIIPFHYLIQWKLCG